MRGEADFSMLKITIGYVILAFLLAYIYPKGYSGGSSFSEGLRFGFIMGLLYTIPSTFIFSGAFKFPFNAILIDSLYHIFEVVAGSVVIAKIYGEK
jgi:hypothetical protein